MLHRIRDQIGTAGLVVAIIALVAALGGGAYAASGGLTAKQKKEVKAIAKSFQGTGPTGAQGLAGPQGSPGINGSNGTNGTNGSPWTAGGTLPSKSTETGAWQISQLPGAVYGQTAVSFAIPLSAADANLVSTQVHVMQTTDVSPPTGCTGGSLNQPKADPGNLCIYVGAAEGIGITEQKALEAYKPDNVTLGVSTSGTVLYFPTVESGGVVMGTYAVTAS